MNPSLVLGSKAKPNRHFARWAKHLTKDRTRRRLATGLKRAVESAERPPQYRTTAVPVQREAVLACRAELLMLVERLQGPEPVYAQGVALVAELLGKGDSALYQPGADVLSAVEAAIAALDGQLDEDR